MREVKDTAVRGYADALEFGLAIGTGLLAGFGTGSVLAGIVAGGIGIIIALWIASKIWPIWMCGPRTDELHTAITRFHKKSSMHSLLEMRVNQRKFKLYRKESTENSRIMRLELPWEHWRDCFEQGEFKSGLERIGSEIHEDDESLLVDAANGADQIVELIECVLQAANAELNDLELNSSFLIFDVRQ